MRTAGVASREGGEGGRSGFDLEDLDKEGSGSDDPESLGGSTQTLWAVGPKVPDAVGPSPQPDYLNAVAEIRTTLTAEKLLDVLLATENILGRVRRGKWGPRTIDLDLLLFGEAIIHQPNLIVPHPQMHLRSFVLDGLCALDGQLMHPLFQEPACELARRLGGGDFTLTTTVPQLVSIAGLIGVGKTTLMKRLATALDAEMALEPYDTNPFLPRVYAGQHELALDSQLYFLLHRAQQLQPESLSREKVSLTDYVFEKELIYARRLLAPEQLDLYERIYEPFAERVTAPVLVVYLQDTPGFVSGLREDPVVRVIFEVPVEEEAPTDGGAGGLTVYGRRTGRYPIDPTVILETSRDIVWE